MAYVFLYDQVFLRLTNNFSLPLMYNKLSSVNRVYFCLSLLLTLPQFELWPPFLRIIIYIIHLDHENFIYLDSRLTNLPIK